MPIVFENVHYTYAPKTPMAFSALKGIDLSIEEGSFTAIIGKTGCGKSTLVQHINALFFPTQGTVEVDDFVIASGKKKKPNLKQLRRNVGLVFQFPEYQLFEETVLKDVAYGPKNFGLKEAEAIAAAKEALSLVGLDESFYNRSPFELSGGEKRRVAIAGILAIRPKYLVVDEPTAGLDPIGAKELMSLFEKIHQEGTTILLVTHDMNLVLNYCDHVLVLEDGKVVKSLTPSALFEEEVERYSLETPILYRTIRSLKEKGLPLSEESISDVASLAKAIKGALAK